MFKENLLSALKSAVTSHNGGTSDNDAVIKAASEFQFNPEQTQRLVETYNTAKTVSFYKTAEDRAGQFTLADGGEVLKTLFANKPKQAEVKATVLKDYTWYDGKPMTLIEDEGDGVEMWTDPTVKAASEKPLSEAEIHSMLLELDNLEMTAEKCASTAGLCEMECGTTLDKLAYTITQLGEAAEALACFTAIAPKTAESLVPFFQEKFLKVAEADIPQFSAFDTKHPELADQFKFACECYTNAAIFNATSKEFVKMADELKSKIPGMGKGETVPEAGAEFFSDEFKSADMKKEVGGSASKNKPLSSLIPDLGDPIGAVAGGIGKGLSGAGQNVTSDAMSHILGNNYESQTKALTDKAKNLHRKFILEKMITSDPILSGVPEEDVIKGYMTIVQLAPEVSLNEEVVRSILRTSTNAQSLDPFAAKQFVDLDTAIRGQVEQRGGKKVPGKV